MVLISLAVKRVHDLQQHQHAALPQTNLRQANVHDT
jgi:hypothetical protein